MGWFPRACPFSRRGSTSPAPGRRVGVGRRLGDWHGSSKRVMAWTMKRAIHAFTATTPPAVFISSNHASTRLRRVRARLGSRTRPLRSSVVEKKLPWRDPASLVSFVGAEWIGRTCPPRESTIVGRRGGGHGDADVARLLGPRFASARQEMCETRRNMHPHAGTDPGRSREPRAARGRWNTALRNRRSGTTSQRCCHGHIW